MKRCKNCGAELLDSDVYCIECGAKASLNRCPKCGEILRPGSKFCNSCGAKLDEANANFNVAGTFLIDDDTTRPFHGVKPEDDYAYVPLDSVEPENSSLWGDYSTASKEAYESAKAKMAAAKTETDFLDAAEEFRVLGKYLDSREREIICLNRADAIKKELANVKILRLSADENIEALVKVTGLNGENTEPFPYKPEDSKKPEFNLDKTPTEADGCAKAFLFSFLFIVAFFFFLMLVSQL